MFGRIYTVIGGVVAGAILTATIAVVGPAVPVYADDCEYDVTTWCGGVLSTVRVEADSSAEAEEKAREDGWTGERGWVDDVQPARR